MKHEEITIKFDLSLEDDHDYNKEELVEAIVQSLVIEVGQYLPELKEFKVWVEH